MRITKRDNPVTGYHSYRRIGTTATFVHPGNGLEYSIHIHPQPDVFLQLMRKYIQKYFGIGVGINLPQVLLKQFLFQFICIGEIAVMRQADAIGRIDIKWLCLSRTLASGCRVTYMTDTHIALQASHVAGVKNITHQAIILAQVQPLSLTGNNPGSVLATMLQYGQTVVNSLIDGTVSNNAYYAALNRLSWK